MDTDHATKLSLRRNHEPFSSDHQVPETPPSKLQLKRRRAMSPRDSSPSKASKKEDHNRYYAQLYLQRYNVS